jgi:hypothetical protein
MDCFDTYSVRNTNVFYHQYPLDATVGKIGPMALR